MADAPEARLGPLERNELSVKLAKRLGMRQEARLVHNEVFKGEWSTKADFAILA